MIETARFQALSSKQKVSLEFKNDKVCLENSCYLDRFNVRFTQPMTFTFNENGNIQKAGHVDFLLNGKNYRLIFNVGEGAYHIE